jgi:hypothetical protein
LVTPVQLNLGNVLHQHKDIHLPGETDDEDERALLKESFKKLKSKVSLKKRTGEKGEEDKVEEDEETDVTDEVMHQVVAVENKVSENR